MEKKYVRVMDGTKSNAGGINYKINEVNVANNWNPYVKDPEKMGGFSFSTDEKILRWLHRGDTLYDVIIPEDAEIITVNEDKGIYRSNKIYVTNPQPITNELVLKLYEINTLPDKVIAECLITLLWKKRKEISKYIINERVNKSNVDEIIKSFESYASKYDFIENKYDDDTQELYDMLKEIQNRE